MKARVYYNKLIRDKIPERIRGKGEACEIRSIEDEQEFQQELLKKIAEEARAVSMVRTRKELLHELSDLLAVVESLKTSFGITQSELKSALTANRKEKGGFSKRLFLHWSSDKKYRSNETTQGIKQ